MWLHQDNWGDDDFHVERPPFESISERLYEGLKKMSEVYNLQMSEEIIMRNLRFMEVCYHFEWSIHVFESYLKSQTYLLHCSLWNGAEIKRKIEEEADDFKNGDMLIGWYYNQHGVAERIVFGSKSSAVKSMMRKIKDLVIPTIEEQVSPVGAR